MLLVSKCLAGVIHHCMNGLSKPVKDKERARFDSLCTEFGIAGVT